MHDEKIGDTEGTRTMLRPIGVIPAFSNLSWNVGCREYKRLKLNS